MVEARSILSRFKPREVVEEIMSGWALAYMAPIGLSL